VLHQALLLVSELISTRTQKNYCEICCGYRTNRCGPTIEKQRNSKGGDEISYIGGVVRGAAPSPESLQSLGKRKSSKGRPSRASHYTVQATVRAMEGLLLARPEQNQAMLTRQQSSPTYLAMEKSPAQI